MALVRPLSKSYKIADFYGNLYIHVPVFKLYKNAQRDGSVFSSAHEQFSYSIVTVHYVIHDDLEKSQFQQTKLQYVVLKWCYLSLYLVFIEYV